MVYDEGTVVVIVGDGDERGGGNAGDGGKRWRGRERSDGRDHRVFTGTRLACGWLTARRERLPEREVISPSLYRGRECTDTPGAPGVCSVMGLDAP